MSTPDHEGGGSTAPAVLAAGERECLEAWAKTRSAETPVRDHLASIERKLRDGWRLTLDAPPGEYASSAWAASPVTLALAEAIAPSSNAALVAENERLREEQDFRLQNDREWKAKVDYQKSRAEAKLSAQGSVAEVAEREAQLSARVAELEKEKQTDEEEIARLEDELSDARYEPWPEWARKVLAVIRKRSGYDGYDDAENGVDLPEELDETMAELEREAERGTQDARAEREVERHKAAAEHYKRQAEDLRAALAAQGGEEPA